MNIHYKMTFRHSLKRRIIIAFCGFGFILAVLYWLLIDISKNLTEDMVFTNRLKNEITAYLDDHKTDPKTPLPHSAYIRSYLGQDAMPKDLQQMVSGLGEGYYETDGPNGIPGPEDYHLAVKKMPDHKEYLYLIFDVGTLKINEKYESFFQTLLFFTSIAVALAGGIIGGLIARQVIAPVTELAAQVAQSDPDNLPLELSKRFANDEVGILAANLEQSNARVRAFIEREKAFTRDASHELRTPVTVILGAVELITQLPAFDDPAIKRPVRRIERSIKGMALTIETFLWLAREDTDDRDHFCDVRDLVKEIFEEQKALHMEKPIMSDLVLHGAPVIHAPAAVFSIVMNNLMANAFHHTAQGKILVTLQDHGIDLFNSSTVDIGSPMAPSVRGRQSQGFGFGLAIVNRVCERFGWQLEIRPDENRAGTLVRLLVSPQDPKEGQKE